jgi:hypothetical protein
MFNIIKKNKSWVEYLGYDDTGNHEWKSDRLDAIRFATESDAREAGHSLNSIRVVPTDNWDGHYEAYKDYEVQVFRDDLNGKPGGKRWRYRLGPTLATDRAYEYTPGKMGYTSFNAALRAAKTCVDKKTALIN